MLVNPYSIDVKFKNFPDLDNQIKLYYNKIFDTVVDYEITPRYFYETGLKIAFRDMFYYIDTLYNNKPRSIIDVGCGECVWKNWFPDIVGFDPNINEFSKQDFQDFFDKDFSQGHADCWDNGMAVNSLHFIDWDKVNDQIDLAMNIVKKCFLFTFNFNVMYNVPNVPMKEQVKLLYQKLLQSKFKIILFDAPVFRGIKEDKIMHWTHVNGTVRFILGKE